MLTKNEIADLVIEGLAGGAAPDSRKWHRGVLRKMVDTVLSEAIGKLISSKVSEGNYSVESTWIKAFEKVYIKYDSARGQCYVDFPARIISLEQNRGLREVRFPNESVAAEPFQIIDGLAQTALSQLECSILSDGNYFAAVEGDRIYFPNMSYLFSERKAYLRIKMICGSDGYSNSEPLPIPDELANTVVMKTIAAFEPQRRQPMKVTNDKNPGSI